MPASYKDKTAGLVQLVEKRTQEAAGWKMIAERRLEALETISASLHDLEKAMVRSPLSHFLSVPIAPTLEQITATHIAEGVDSVEEFASQMDHVLKDIVGTFTATCSDIEGALAWGDTDLSVPPELREEADLSNGLSLEEMGAYDRPTDVVHVPVPPPSPPRSATSPPPVATKEVTTLPKKEGEERPRKHSSEKHEEEKHRKSSHEKHEKRASGTSSSSSGERKKK